MDDQTRGETPGAGPGLDVPLKRDRKRLRSSESLPERAASPAAPPARPSSELPEGVQEPELTPVEQLFATQRTASVPTQAPAVPPAHVPSPPSALAERTPPIDPPPLTSPPASLSTPSPPTPSSSTTTPLTDATQRYDLDLSDADDDTPADDAPPARRFFGLTLPRKAGRPADPPTEALQARPEPEPTVPYVPPGGFSGPGHPRLGPLAPVPAERNSVLAGLDIAAMVTAVILPPIGLVTAIVAVVKGKQLRGWVSDLARAAISVSLVMTVVFAAVGGYLWYTETEKAEHLAAVKADQRAHALVAAASEPFCGVLAANPAIYSTADPDYGWPAVDAPEGYNTAIANYSTVWAELAAVAPDGIATETAAISERVAGVVSIANALGSANRAGDLLELHAQTDLATVESWYVEYCDVPETPAE